GSEPALIARERQRRAVAEARDGLVAARALARRAPELCAEEVRLAERALERLVGRNDVEAVLGAIFSRFCIGK
ncbi:MAG TPA: tRNA uridine-5-carboxymethylaminomethyl(34) synthesis GTPase MnmE, partial [Beijerinckiaceae bacterium]|nr:tRNA uridine-5-carboxymethylaminomethyl(34) synthesis GTPase MnmE [Beijerinckiaceae bacterium]